MRNQSITKGIIILTPCVILNTLAMDIFVPCIPALQHSLNSSFSKTQLILSVFMLSTGLGQILVGPLADRYGRRIIMLSSIFIFLCASIVCAQAQTMNTLIIARLFQGLGSCGTIVVTFAVVRDVFNESNRSRMYSYLDAAISLAPMFAPILGGYLYIWFDTWRASFYFLALFSAITMISTYKMLPETNPDLTEGYSYVTVFRNKEFWCYVLCAVTALSALFLYFSISPILLINTLGIHPVNFSYLFALNAVAYIIFSIISPRLRDKVGIVNCILISSVFIVLGAFIMLFWHHIYGLTVLGLIVPNLIITAGLGLLWGPCTSGALSPFKKLAGTASAAYGTIEYSGTAIIGTVVLQFEVKNALNLGITIAALGIMNLILGLILKNITTSQRNS